MKKYPSTLWFPCDLETMEIYYNEFFSISIRANTCIFYKLAYFFIYWDHHEFKIFHIHESKISSVPIIETYSLVSPHIHGIGLHMYTHILIIFILLFNGYYVSSLKYIFFSKKLMYVLDIERKFSDIKFALHSRYKTGVLNDPLGQTHSHASSELFSVVLFC